MVVYGDIPIFLALQLSGVSKSYRVGHIRRRLWPALVDLSLDVPRGEIFGCLGPNGSGKTTTLKLLVGLLAPDAGTVRVLGSRPDHSPTRGRIGYLPENPYFYDYLSPREYLDYAGRLFGIGRAERRHRTNQLLDRVGLADWASKPLRRFSKGMVQRLGLAQALINDPELLVLDEPMSGLDPLGRHMVRELMLDLKRQGKTIVLCTHVLPDAEALCDRVAVLREGRLLAVGLLEDILRMDIDHLEVLVSGVSATDLAEESLAAMRELGGRLSFRVREGGLGSVVQRVEQCGGRVLSVQPVRQSLEEYFVSEIGSAAQDR